MTEPFEEDPQARNYTSNQLRSNQIKNKKNSLGLDWEALYADNIDLRNRIR
jgi:hypothetical protein